MVNMSTKRIKRNIVIIIAILLGGFVLFQFPHLYFKKQFSYKSFDVYSNEQLDKAEAIPILDIVEDNIVKSAFYQKDQKFKLVFVGGSKYQKLLHLLDTKNIASSKFNLHIYNGKANFKSNILVAGEYPLQKVNLEQIIAHECVHSQMYPEHSTLGVMETPHWINEGYCEYISYRKPRESKVYSVEQLWTTLKKDKNQWLKTSYGHYSPREYVEALIMVEYLIEEKNMTIQEIIATDSINPHSIQKEISIELNN